MYDVSMYRGSWINKIQKKEENNNGSLLQLSIHRIFLQNNINGKFKCVKYHEPGSMCPVT